MCSVSRLFLLRCQYQCKWLTEKTRLWNDLWCVDVDVKPYSLTHVLWWLVCVCEYRAVHVSGTEDLLLYLASSDDERQFAFHVLEIISLMFREQVSPFNPWWYNILYMCSVCAVLSLVHWHYWLDIRKCTVSVILKSFSCVTMLDARCNHGNNNNTPFSRTIQVSRYQNATILDLLELLGGAENWS